MSYVILITFLLENIFLDYSLKSTIKDLNVFLHNVLCRYEGLVIGEIYWSDVHYSSEALLPLAFLLQSGLTI